MVGNKEVLQNVEDAIGYDAVGVKAFVFRLNPNPARGGQFRAEIVWKDESVSYSTGKTLTAAVDKLLKAQSLL